MDEFKHRIKFHSTCSVKLIPQSNLKSIASLDELRELESLITNKQEVLDNPDLLYIVFNAAVVNLVNLNGDAIATDVALSIIDKFKNKPINIEHCSSDVVGFVSNAGFSTFPDNKMLDKSSISGLEPFNICLSGIVWKTVSGIADILCACNEEDSWMFKDLSTSWEVGFNEYDIAVGSKNLSKATIISDPEEVKKKSKYLKYFGGSGFDENNDEVYVIIKGDAIPLGVAITANPAAAVKGISVVDAENCCEEPTEEVELDDMEEEMSSLASDNKQLIDDLINSNKNILEKISQLEKYTVKASNSDMKKIENVDDLFELLSSASEAERPSPRDIVAFIREQISALNDKFTAEQSAKASKEAELSSISTKNAELADKLSSVETELATLRESIASQEKQNRLDARLSRLDDTYNLDDKARALIIKNIASLNDADYSAWLNEDGSVILSGKEKTPSTQEPEQTPEQILSTASVSTASIPNTPEISSPSNKPVAKSVKVTLNKHGVYEISTK